MLVKDIDLAPLASAAKSASASFDELGMAISQIKRPWWFVVDSAGNHHSIRSRKRIGRLVVKLILEREQQRKESM